MLTTKGMEGRMENWTIVASSPVLSMVCAALGTTKCLIYDAKRREAYPAAPSFPMHAAGRRLSARPCNPAPGVRCLLLYEATPAVARARGDDYGYACSRRAAYYA